MTPYELYSANSVRCQAVFKSFVSQDVALYAKKNIDEVLKDTNPVVEKPVGGKPIGGKLPPSPTPVEITPILSEEDFNTKFETLREKLNEIKQNCGKEIYTYTTVGGLRVKLTTSGDSLKTDSIDLQAECALN